MKRNVKFLSILMAMTILLTSAVFAEPTFAEGEGAIGWDGSAATEFAGGTGSEEDPYLISSAAELAYLASYTNSKKKTEGMYFKVADGVREIDLNNQPWTPVGNADAARFKGIFDGNNAVIKNLSLNGITTAQVGLFGMIEGATVKNVTVHARFTEPNAKNTMIGGLAGRAVHKDKTAVAGNTVSNCNVYADFSVSVAADCYLGVAFGMMGGASVLDNINTYGTVSVTSTNSAKEVVVGGIVGRVRNQTGNPTIQSCNNYATITAMRAANGTTAVGGIVGATYQKVAAYKTLTLTDCVNYGAVSAVTTDYGRSGGLVGNMGKSMDSVPDILKLQYCVNLGDVTAAGEGKQCGSLVGFAEGENLSVANCFSAAATAPIGAVGTHSSGSAPKCQVNGEAVTTDTVQTALSGHYVGGIALSTLTGARVRIDTAAENNTSGLRFDSTVAASAFDALTAANLDVELGTVIAPTENLVAVAAAYDKIVELEAKSTEAAPTYIKVPANTAAWVNNQYRDELGEDYDASVNYFTGAVAGIYEANYTLAYSAVAYLTVTVGDWSFTFYANDGVENGAMSEARSRTVAYVGYMAYNDSTVIYDANQTAILKRYADRYTATNGN